MFVLWVNTRDGRMEKYPGLYENEKEAKSFAACILDANKREINSVKVVNEKSGEVEVNLRSALH